MKTPSLLSVLLIVAVMFTSPIAAKAQSAGKDPAEVTQELYGYAMKNPGFGVNTVKGEKPWLAPDLYERMLKKAKQQDASKDGPDIDMDVILAAQDNPDKFAVGKPVVDQDKAKVEVSLTLSADKWKTTVMLKLIAGKWLVYDIDYGKDGKLSALFK